MDRDGRIRFYTTVTLGPNRARTPEGFLICYDVAIARTGDQLYGRNSTPVDVGPDGFAVVARDADEVFRPETLASFNGAPITNGHPSQDVVPENWNKLAKGVVLHPRRGEGEQHDLLLADLKICDAEMIELVLAGKDEVSCGYDANYRQLAVGRGKQVDIVGNHLAIVEAGRCGGRCSIRDHAETGEGVVQVAKTKIANVVETIRRKFADASNEEEIRKALDSKEVKEAVKDAEEEEEGKNGDTHVHVKVEDAPRSKWSDAAIEERFKSMDEKLDEILEKRKTDDETEEEKEEREKRTKAEDEDEDEEKKKKVTDEDKDEFEKEAKEGTKDARKVRDSASFDESFQETVSLAEVLAPGIRIPTFDAAASPKRTLDAMCSLRRKALRIASDTEVGSVAISSVRRGRQMTHDALEQMNCSQVRDLFYSAGGAMKLANASATRAAGVRTVDASEFKAVGGVALSPAEFNKSKEKFWASQNK